MKSKPNGLAFRITFDVERIADCNLNWGEDIIIDEYDGYEKFSITDTDIFDHPTPVIYQGYLDAVKQIDYLISDNGWNVMSRRMYEVLLSVGDFPHRVVPVAIVDWRVPKKDWFDSNGELRKEISLSNYLVIHLTEHLDIFDYEKSKYIRNNIEYEDGYVDDSLNIKEYVFKIPEEGLPPIFKVPENTVLTFASMKARKTLKNAGVNSCYYTPLDGDANREISIDVPVILPKEIQQQYCNWIKR